MRRPLGLWLARSALVTVSFACALLAGEIMFRSSSAAPAEHHVYEEMNCRRLNPLLGGGYRRDCSTRWKKWTTDGGTKRVLFDTHFTTDHWAHRVVPGGLGTGRPDQALFFGCSFTAGAGVNDDETLPSYFAAHAPGVDVYNFAGSGFGPEQMLVMLTETDLEPVHAKPGRTIGVYVFLHFHIARAVGTYEVSTTIGRYFPYYHFDRDGTLVQSGDFTTGRPWRMRTYDLIARSKLSFLQSLLVSYSQQPSRAEAELTSAIIRSSAEAFRKRFASDEFYVALYPAAKARSTDPSLRS
jgi:hypothetical protein